MWLDIYLNKCFNENKYNNIWTLTDIISNQFNTKLERGLALIKVI